MATLTRGNSLTPFNFSQQLNLNHYIDNLDQVTAKPVLSSPRLGSEPLPLFPRSGPALQGQTSTKSSSGLWDRSWQPILFISETSIMLASLAMATTETIAFQQGVGIQGRSGHLAGWTIAGTTGGAALGNLSCAVLDVNNDYGQCDLVGGLLGSLAAFFLADHYVPQNIPGIRRSGPGIIQVQMPPIPVVARPVQPTIGIDHQWPRDEYGP